MRRRLVIAFVGLAVGIIVLVGIPRTVMVVDLVVASQERNVNRLAQGFAVVVAELDDHGEVTEQKLDTLLAEGEGIEVTTSDGEVVYAGEPVNRPQDITATAEVEGGGSLTFSRSETIVSDRIREAVLPSAVVGIALTLVAAGVALLIARRLSKPFTRLAEMAAAMGDGSFEPDTHDLKIPEARAIASALRTSADTLETRIRREHEFAANASHQLRTPITALRLELEDLSLWKETPPEVAAQLQHALGEIDRLSEAIGQLLELARGGTPGADTAVPLAPMLAQAAERWRPQAESLGRTISVRAQDLDGATAPTPAGQIFDVLLHNALVHGRGEVVIDVVPATGYLTVRVADEGARPPGNTIFQRTPGRSTGDGEGIGLALSAELAEALGGHLLLDSAPTTRFSLMLPQRRAEASV
ncbi:sensor histidine kinase [Agromyces soli]